MHRSISIQFGFLFLSMCITNQADKCLDKQTLQKGVTQNLNRGLLHTPHRVLLRQQQCVRLEDILILTIVITETYGSLKDVFIKEGSKFNASCQGARWIIFFNSYLIFYQFILDCLFFLNSLFRKPVFGSYFYVEYIKGLDSVQTKGFSYEILPWTPNPTLSQETFELL